MLIPKSLKQVRMLSIEALCSIIVLAQKLSFTQSNNLGSRKESRQW